MWSDREEPGVGDGYFGCRPYLRADKKLWDDTLIRMANAGMNMAVIDLGDGVKYESHPEIAVKRAWSVGKLKKELAKMRAMGIEPIPKLNFSTCHDTWLGPYARKVSTPEYYRVCKDLIAEVIDIFQKPRFFHLGMDEETPGHQRAFDYVVVRQADLWWHDFLFLVKEVEKKGVRAWIWSDYVWHHPDLFFERMPKSVLQSNWYYGKRFSKEIGAVRAYLELDAHGYDQIPTGANWTCTENIGGTVNYGRRNIDPKRFLGFLLTYWRPTLESCRPRIEEAIDLTAEAKRRYEKRMLSK